MRDRRWISREQFVDLLGVANLIPGPTSTELAMHVGRHRAGWIGLVIAGLAFILPAALLMGVLAAVYVRHGDLPVIRGVLAAVQPVVLVVILDALVPLARTTLRTGAAVAVGAGAAGLAASGVPEIAVLLVAGVVHACLPRQRTGVALAGICIACAATALAAWPPAAAGPTDVFLYFLRVGALLFGSGYVLLPVLAGDLVDRRGWLTHDQLIDAIAAGQATPGPVFTTATFAGYLVGGPLTAVVATAGIFLPAFVAAAVASAMLDRIRQSARARAFLTGVNAAAVALIALVLVTLAREDLTSAWSVGHVVGAAILVLVLRLSPSLVLLGAAAGGAAFAAVAG